MTRVVVLFTATLKIAIEAPIYPDWNWTEPKYRSSMCHPPNPSTIPILGFSHIEMSACSFRPAQNENYIRYHSRIWTFSVEDDFVTHQMLKVRSGSALPPYGLPHGENL
jgi:hypothetical protein